MAEPLMIADLQSASEVIGGLNVSVADLTMSLVSDDTDLILGVDGAAKAFVVDKRSPDVEIRVRWGDLSEERGGEKLFDSGRVWQLFSEKGAYLFKFTSKLHPWFPYKAARFNLDFTRGEVALHRPYFAHEQFVYPLAYPLDELLIMNLLARGRGAELHSCGVVDEDGRGYLFVGQSGAGKTTTARLWEKERGVKILSDDRIIVRQFDGKFWMYGTPWHGEAELANASKAPLTHIFFLQQSQHNGLMRQSRAESAARLFACGFPPFHDPPGLEFTAGFFDELTKAVPCHELRFNNDEKAVEFVRQQTE